MPYGYNYGGMIPEDEPQVSTPYTPPTSRTSPYNTYTPPVQGPRPGYGAPILPPYGSAPPPNGGQPIDGGALMPPMGPHPGVPQIHPPYGVQPPHIGPINGPDPYGPGKRIGITIPGFPGGSGGSHPMGGISGGGGYANPGLGNNQNIGGGYGMVPPGGMRPPIAAPPSNDPYRPRPSSNKGRGLGLGNTRGRGF